MPQAPELTLAFIEAHPSDAARVLEHQTAEAATALLEAVPVRLAGPVVRHMLPATAARCLARLGAETAAGMLHAMDARSGAALLRHLPRERRDTLLEQLPTTTAVGIRLLLGYPADTAGAWMDVTAMAFPPDTTASEALEIIRRATDGAEFVYVADSEQRLQGSVAIAELLRAPDSMPLSRLMRRDVPRVSALAALASLNRPEIWDDLHTLPVTERRDRFVGTLRFTTLRQALTQDDPHARPDGAETGALTNLATAYWQVFAGLLQGTIALLPAAHAPRQKNQP